MKSLFRNILVWTLLLCLLIPTALVGCNKEDADKSKIEFYITTPLGSDVTTRKQASELERRLIGLGYTVVLRTDSEETAQDYIAIPEGAYEILLGKVGHETATALVDSLGTCGWAVKKEDKKLFLTATSTSFLPLAVESLAQTAFSNAADPLEEIADNSVQYTDLAYLVKDGVPNVEVAARSDADEKAAATLFAEKLAELTKTDVKQLYQGDVEVVFQKEANIPFNSYSVAHKDGKLTVSARDNTGLLSAATGLYDLLRSFTRYSSTKMLYFPVDVSLGEIAIKTALPVLPYLEGAEFYDANLCATSYSIALEKSSKEVFDAYAATIEGMGYSLRDTRSIAYNYIKNDPLNYAEGAADKTNEFRLYTNRDYMVYMYFCQGNGNIRVIGANISEFENYAAVRANASVEGEGETLFAMLDIGAQNETDPSWIFGQGMCFVYKLNDGRFIIIDGGQWEDQDTAGSEATRLYNWLLEHSNDGKIVIAAWLLTHGHSDHVNIAFKFEQLYGTKVEIEYFMYNFPTYDYTISMPNSDMSTGYYKDRYPRTASMLNRYDCLIPHTGMIYRFANCTVEIVYTHEDFYPRKISDYNNSCTVFKITVGGYSFLVAGDLEEPGQEHCISQTGDYLDVDFIQATHHGYNGLKQFYMYATNDTDTIALWPLPVGSSWTLTTNAVGDVNRWLMNNASENIYSYDGNYVIRFE